MFENKPLLGSLASEFEFERCLQLLVPSSSWLPLGPQPAVCLLICASSIRTWSP
jgi:hypothetical protein